MKQRSIILIAVSVLFLLLPMISLAECPADFDCDGDVDAQDLTILAKDLGSVDCGPCAPNMIPEDYRPPVGLVRTFNSTRYPTSLEPYILTVSVGETETTWAYEDGSSEIYALGKEEFYDTNGELIRACLHDPSEFTSLSDGPKHINESWGGYYATSCNDGTGRVNLRMFTLLDIEDVTVPAGTFQNCLKIFRNRGSSYSSTIIWFAPGMGWIKRVYEFGGSGGLVYELSSYQMPN